MTPKRALLISKLGASVEQLSTTVKIISAPKFQRFIVSLTDDGLEELCDLVMRCDFKRIQVLYNQYRSSSIEGLTLKELRVRARELKIYGYRYLTKEGLITHIINLTGDSDETIARPKEHAQTDAGVVPGLTADLDQSGCQENPACQTG